MYAIGAAITVAWWLLLFPRWWTGAIAFPQPLLWVWGEDLYLGAVRAMGVIWGFLTSLVVVATVTSLLWPDRVPVPDPIRLVVGAVLGGEFLLAVLVMFFGWPSFFVPPNRRGPRGLPGQAPTASERDTSATEHS